VCPSYILDARFLKVNRSTLKLMCGMHSGGILSGDHELILFGVFSFAIQQDIVH
jgi:hypothetical protein